MTAQQTPSTDRPGTDQQHRQPATNARAGTEYARRAGWIGYAVAVLAEGLYAILLHLLHRQVPLTEFPVFYAIIAMPVAYAYGLGPWLLAFLLSAVQLQYYFVPPQGSFGIAPLTPHIWAGIAAYLLSNTVGVVGATLIRRYNRTLIAEVARHKQTAEALHASEGRLRATLESMVEEVWILDGEGEIVLVNEAGVLNMGFLTRLEFFRDLPQALKELEIHYPNGTVRPPDRAPLMRALAGEVIRSEEEYVRNRSTGELRYREGSAAPVRDDQGQIIGAVGVVRDITDRKKAEDALRELTEQLEQRVRDRTAQLEAANKELESFSYSVSHDLRAPLRIVDGFSVALLEDYGDKLDQQGAEYLNFVRDSAQRMGRLIDDLLRLSRVGRAEMRMGDVDLSALAEDIVGDLRQQFPERQVDVTIEPGMIARGDADLLRIMLENLLRNAWKYTAERPKASVEFSVALHDGVRVYYVRDNGAGFDMAYADKLFTPFQRLHSESEFPGTGIGLTIVRRIVNRHGGKAWAEGSVGEGATFYFTLPTERRSP